jgi:hypothetical protein
VKDIYKANALFGRVSSSFYLNQTIHVLKRDTTNLTTPSPTATLLLLLTYCDPSCCPQSLPAVTAMHGGPYSYFD